MFPFRRFLRLTATLLLLCLITFVVLKTVLLVLIIITQNSQYNGFSLTVVKSCNHSYFSDDSSTLKNRFAKEFEYKERLSALSPVQIQEYSEQFYRNVTIQWGERRLLPPSKPLFHSQCVNYLNRNYNLQVSVVLSYHNELSVLLLRTLTTIMHRTPLKYLREIILIDDHSTLNITAEVLEYARHQRMPVRHLTNPETLGIARSRLRGVHEAVGEVVVLLDSHMEVSELWLEPLLSTLEKYPGGVTVPIIHMIQETEYKELGHVVHHRYVVQPQRGWGHITMYPYEEVDPSRDMWDPVPSASLMGGALAAHRSTLLDFYPGGVVESLWGVENNRLSFRVWMCGEGVWLSSCSQVLHPNGNDPGLVRYFGNNDYLRHAVILESVAEAINFVGNNSVLKEKILSKVASTPVHLQKIKTISNKIREEFNPEIKLCKSLEWYLREVFVNYITWEQDQFDQVGEVRSVHNPNMCLEVHNRKLALYNCRGTPPVLGDTHLIGFTKNQLVFNGDLLQDCWDTSWDTFSEERAEVRVFSCHVQTPVEGQPSSTQRFLYDQSRKAIVHPSSNRCLEYVNSSTVLLMWCVPERVTQQWEVLTSVWF